MTARAAVIGAGSWGTALANLLADKGTETVVWSYEQDVADDINRLQTVTDGKLVISPEELQTVAAGPVTLMLYKEVEKTLEKGTLSGGRLSITYGLSREFELVK